MPLKSLAPQILAHGFVSLGQSTEFRSLDFRVAGSNLRADEKLGAMICSLSKRELQEFEKVFWEGNTEMKYTRSRCRTLESVESKYRSSEGSSLRGLRTKASSVLPFGAACCADID